jgi:hypothetical protein
MEINDWLVVGMFLTFIGFLFTGIPVAYVLGGVGSATCRTCTSTPSPVSTS